MRNRYWFFFLLPLLLGTYSEGIEKEIIVLLHKKESCPLIYISSDCAELRDLLLFDLSQNGITKGVSQRPKEEEHLSNSPFSSPFWNDLGYVSVLKVECVDQWICGFMVLCETGEKINITPRFLGVESRLKRGVMHQVAEEIHSLITKKKSIFRSKIYYAVQSSEGVKSKSEIWMADYDGKNARQLTRENSYSIHPTLFPVQGAFTKNKYLYVNYKLGQPKIYINSFGRPKGKPLLPIRGSQLLPTLSKKGDMIAFICDAGGQADLFVQPFDPDKGPLGKPIQLYSYPHSVQASPTFRPDGKKIAFVSDWEKTPRIYLIDVPTTQAQRSPRLVCLTKKYRENTTPAWSPDGKKLAYSARIDGFRQIMVYDFVTQEEIQLTCGAIHKENPSWSEESMHIIFNTVSPSSSELFLINLKQREMVQITEGPGRKHYPTWGY